MYEVTSKSTQHGLKSPYGFKTPHRMPSYTLEGESKTDIFRGLITKLYPTGRAFYLKKGGNWDLLHEAINRSFIRLYEDSKLTIDSVLPDNDNFTDIDATLLEWKLGLTTNALLSLNDRKQALIRKLTSPANLVYRQSK